MGTLQEQIARRTAQSSMWVSAKVALVFLGITLLSLTRSVEGIETNNEETGKLKDAERHPEGRGSYFNRKVESIAKIVACCVTPTSPVCDNFLHNMHHCERIYGLQ